MPQEIYLDAAATSLYKPKAVATAVSEVLTSGTYGNPSRGAYPCAKHSFQAIEVVREKIQALFHTTSYSVAFTENATMALNIALKGLILPKSHVLTTTWEHNAVLRPLYQLEREKEVELSFIPSEPLTGHLCYEAMEDLLQENTQVLVCNLVSNVTGNRLDLERIKDFCKKHQLLLIVDASQAAGHIDLDLSDQAIAVLCFTGHKGLLGPMGVGGLCLRSDLEPMDPLLTGGDGVASFSHDAPLFYPERLEAGTLNVPNIVGLGAALDFIATYGVTALQEHEEELSTYLRVALQERNLIVYGEGASSLVSWNVKDVPSGVVAQYLGQHGFAVRSGFHCAPKMHEALGTKDQGTVRCSFSPWTTEDDLKALLYCIDTLQKEVS